ncbi:MAG: glycosyltransferase family 2 protein [Bacteroidales bacterium]|nr:glycosyltransferase family 2 protein [Bacteroidales bacterium]
MPDVAILILNWNGKHFLEQFLPALIRYTPSDLAEIIIADNGSTDESLNWIKATYPQISIIELDKNYGFAGGYNLAIESCKNKYILLLNSDVEVSAGWLEPLVAALKSPEVGAVMPKIISENRRTHFEYAGASGGYLDKFGYPFCRGRIFDELEPDIGQYNKPLEVHWTTGACMLIRREVFIGAGKFDADFFAHMEEIDLCWRIRRSGLSLLVVTNSKVFHVGGGTLPNESPAKLYLNFRNNLFLLFKNLPKGKLFPIIITRLLLDGVAAAKYLLSGKFRYTTAIFRSHISFFASIKKLKLKRAVVLKKNSGIVELYPKSIVLQFYLRRKKKFSDLNYK